jgi:hypothetical protein
VSRATGVTRKGTVQDSEDEDDEDDPAKLNFASLYDAILEEGTGI